MIDLYDELGCPRGADEATVKRAYKRRARTTHPDHGGDAEAFTRATQARDVLLDPARRRRYDETGQVDGAPVIDETNQKIRRSLRALWKPRSRRRPAAISICLL